MKSSVFTKLLLILFIAGGFWSCSQRQYSQTSEYDDMYFTSSDRGVKKSSVVYNEPTQNKQNKQYDYDDDSYSARTLNPDYVAKYQSAPADDVESGEDDTEYFKEDYNGDQNYRPNNSYDNYTVPSARSRSFNNFNSFYDPFYDPFYNPAFAYRYGGFYDPFYGGFYQPGFNRFGWRPGFSASLSWGSPFYRNRWNRDPFFYDPFYDPFFCPPLYSSSFLAFNTFNRGFNRVYFVNSSGEYFNNSGRRVSRGTRVGRTSATTTSRSRRNIENTSRSRVNSTANNSGTTSRVSRRNPTTRTQNEYYRSRPSSTRSRDVARTRTVSPTGNTSRSYNRSGYSPSKSSRSSGYSGSNSSNSSRGTTYNRNTRRSGSSVGSSRPSSSRSRSNYTTPRRSSSSYKRSTPSRSSGSSYQRSSGSRSSGSSYGRSSGSSSRSSSSYSRSSSSRSSSSSSGSRSSSSRSRRGN